MIYQNLFFSEQKKKKKKNTMKNYLRFSSAAVVIGALRVTCDQKMTTMTKYNPLKTTTEEERNEYHNRAL